MSTSDSKILKKNKIRNAEYYGMIEVFDELYAKSLEGNNFTNLMSLILSGENIKLAFRNIKKNSGSMTAGVDKLTIKHVKKCSDEKFKAIVCNKFKDYKPKPVRRVEIPKPNGKTRPLGIPAIWDRIVQQCILQVLDPICEAKFHERSNGFRPNRSTEHAIAQCYKMAQTQNLHFVVDIDIKGFFDNVNHGKLLKQMWTLGIRDKNLLSIISKMLKAPIVFPDGSKEYPTKGTPQGGILSPLLSNIVLNELDWWIASQWEEIPTKHKYQEQRHTNGALNQGNKWRALRNTRLKECYIVRYADDFKIFCRCHEDANSLFISTKLWLKERLNLDISEEKSKIVNLRKNYSEYLGIRFKVVMKGKKYVIKSHMSEKAISNVINALKEAIKDIAKPKNSMDQYQSICRYNSIVIGAHQYYRIATHINLDFVKISYHTNRTLYNRLKKELSKKGIATGYISKHYSDSKQLRFISGNAIAPAGYIQHKNPMHKPRRMNKYTIEGRTYIHEKLKRVNMNKLKWLMQNPVKDKTIEYNDNRIARYSAQMGNCAILDEELEIHEIHCHHKIPKSMSGTDDYDNLIIIKDEVHILVHATAPVTIDKYKSLLSLDVSQIKKVNKLRKLVGNKPI